MKLKDYALVAEIISALAIVVSLVFVGFEIRRNTFATYSSTYDNLLSDQIEWRLALGTNPDIADRFTEGRIQGETLDSADEMMLAANVAIYERAYFARFYGRLGDAEWERFRNGMCEPERSGNWLELPSWWFSDEFLDYIRQCSQ